MAHPLPSSFSLLVPFLVCCCVVVVVWWQHRVVVVMWLVVGNGGCDDVVMSCDVTGTGLAQVWVQVHVELPMGYPCYALL